MVNTPVEPDVKNDPTVEPRPAVSGLVRPIRAFGESLPIAANIMAAIGSFLFLIVVPTVLLDFIPLPEEFATILVQVMPTGLLDRVAAALAVALLFLVVVIGFQLWQYRRRLSSWWPVVLAFPVTAILLAPDALAHGGPIIGWATVGVAFALAFCWHWLAVLAIVELMD